MNEKKKSKKLKIAIGIIAVVLLLFTALIGYLTDFLWFKELGYVSVFFKQLTTQLKIGIPTFIVITFVSYIYFKFIKKTYYKKVISNDLDESKTMNAISWLMAAVFGGIVTFYATSKLWFGYLQFANSTDFGYDDPVFGLDISFYIFKIDFLYQLNALIITVLIIFIILTLLYYAVLMSTRPPRVFKNKDASDPFEEADRFDTKSQDTGNKFAGQFNNNPFGRVGDAFGKTMDTFAGGVKNKKGIDDQNIRQLFTIASKQLIFASVCLFLMVGVHFILKQFELLYNHTGAVYGAGYTDVNITLWVYRILAGLGVVGAIAVAIGIKRHNVKLIAIVPAIMLVIMVGGAVAKVGVQNLIVSPNEISKETKYLERNIEYTQKAYGLEDVTTKEFAADNNLTSDDIKKNEATISNVRINDYQPTETFYNQTQSIRQYYTFVDVDVDRYMINGEYTQTFLSAREIDETKINQTWLNKHLKYTHGYGITLSRVDEITPSGQPEMLLKNIPSQSQVEEISVKRPEIYFGELASDYAVVGATEDEFDYPSGDTNKYTRYEGSAGIKLNLLNRLMFSVKESSLKLLVSSNIDSASKIIIHRNIGERVRKIMPYLQYDKDPYMVTENGKLYWIIDAYTSSSNFPYAEPYDVEATQTNYVRNSVKVVIDAYNGTTNFYVVDSDDPIAMTFKKIYPKLFKDIEAMPDEIKQHLRYPNELFDIQAKVYTRYHMNDVRVFYQNEDLWDIANEIYGTEEQQMEPSYYIMNLPGETEAEFVNSIPFTPRDKKNMTGLFVARNDGENYGELVLYKLPKNKLVYGPRQIEAQIDQDTEISKDFSLWNSSGSKYSRGNMFIIPIEDSLLYVEPVYLEASESSIPEVKRVIVVYGDKIAYEKTLAEALNSLFGDGTAQVSSSNKEVSTGEKAEESSTQELINMANEALAKALEAQKKGDWAKYGKHMDELKKYLDQLR